MAWGWPFLLRLAAAHRRRRRPPQLPATASTASEDSLLASLPATGLPPPLEHALPHRLIMLLGLHAPVPWPPSWLPCRLVAVSRCLSGMERVPAFCSIKAGVLSKGSVSIQHRAGAGDCSV